MTLGMQEQRLQIALPIRVLYCSSWEKLQDHLRVSPAYFQTVNLYHIDAAPQKTLLHSAISLLSPPLRIAKLFPIVDGLSAVRLLGIGQSEVYQ